MGGESSSASGTIFFFFFPSLSNHTCNMCSLFNIANLPFLTLFHYSIFLFIFRALLCSTGVSGRRLQHKRWITSFSSIVLSLPASAPNRCTLYPTVCVDCPSQSSTRRCLMAVSWMHVWKSWFTAPLPPQREERREGAEKEKEKRFAHSLDVQRAIVPSSVV